MKKYEIGSVKPENWEPSWPGEFEGFSHFEFAAGIPQVICAITTRKANGLPNVCLHAWNAFSGPAGAFMCLLPGLCEYYHTVENLRREPAFCVNFLSRQHMAALHKTITENAPDVDELAVAGLHAEKAAKVAAPRIAEAFLTLECALESLGPCESESSLMAMGRVLHAAAAEGYMNGIDKRYGPEGFVFNIHAPRDAETGDRAPYGYGTLRVDETY